MTQPRPPVTAPEGGCARLSCCIPFCRRTARVDKAGTPWSPGSEVICGNHWRLINASRRRRYQKLKRMVENRKGKLQGVVADRIEALLLTEWARLKVCATERAAGIA